MSERTGYLPVAPLHIEASQRVQSPDFGSCGICWIARAREGARAGLSAAGRGLRMADAEVVEPDPDTHLRHTDDWGAKGWAVAVARYPCVRMRLSCMGTRVSWGLEGRRELSWGAE